MEQDYNNSGTTLPDYQNFRNIIFQQWEEMHNACVNYRTCKPGNERIQKRVFVDCYLRYFGQIKDTSKLGHLTPAQRKYLLHFNDHPNVINKLISKKITEITRELMVNYGIFNMEGGDDGELW